MSLAATSCMHFLASVAVRSGRAVSSVVVRTGRAIAAMSGWSATAVSSVATSCMHFLASVAVRSRRAVSSVVVRSGRAIAAASGWSAGAMSSVATSCMHFLASVAARSGRAVSSTAALSRHAAASAARHGARAAWWVAVHSWSGVVTASTRSGHAISSAAERGRRAAASVAIRSRPAISAMALRGGHEAVALRRGVAVSSRALMGYVCTAAALLALRCESWSHAAARAAQAGRVRLASVRQDAPPLTKTTLRDLESEGSFVAAALALAVVSYGALLLLSWRDPVPQMSVAASAPAAILATASPAVTPVSRVTTTSAMARTDDPAAADVRPVRARLSTASLRAVWNRGDTRSLQGALTNLRRQTLALHRCGMKVTAADRAVARCDGSSSATYTIDFRRTANRWVIQQVSSR